MRRGSRLRRANWLGGDVLDRDDKTELWRQMMRIRRFEEQVIALHAGGEMVGHFHVYIGQEATGVAVTAALGPDDMIFSTHRNHGHYLARGGDMAAGFAEILGRSTGCNRGMGGSVHLADAAIGMPHTSGVLGSSPALAMGAAFEMKRQGRGRIAVAFFGDGALEEGVALEALNFAALWSLPVLFVCENNSEGAIGAAKGGYPGSIMGTERLTALPEAFAIETHAMDGNNLDALAQMMRDVRARIADGTGPVFVEANTPRWFGNQGLWPDLAYGPLDLGHAFGTSPIPEGPDSDWFTAHDPLLRTARELLQAGVPQDRLEAVAAVVAAEVAQASDAAREGPFPTEGEARALVFAGGAA
jgi:pyruvate dehydrogenase E1 component alpha subunit